ncbi:conserved hypothetical protein [Culex quinquefasciatus]|uniref:NodB homology domain-containing protein n=1 Tax=Culex quinquefasciatus TaxID=7176 RepID=B0W4P8_CULQU|nr:conserved hypothetical protein [Culex quinquefasciatus]|eukprot:XP_001843682.1 conserved hypothetical protein [Culex quinquefasciatus]
MNLLRVAGLLAIFSLNPIYSTSTGTQLADIVEHIFDNTVQTVDICILNGSAVWSWKDLLDEFISKLPEKFAVNQPERLKNAPRQCEFYLISLDPINGTENFNEVTQSFLEALRWNRYGIFVFVALDEHQYEAHLKSFDDLISTGATIYAQSVFYQHQAIGLYPQIKNNLHLLKEAVILMEANECQFIPPLKHLGGTRWKPLKCTLKIGLSGANFLCLSVRQFSNHTPLLVDYRVTLLQQPMSSFTV